MTFINISNKRNDMIKIIAMLTMLIDHIGVLLFPDLLILRTIGRIAFPIFAYQIAIGYSKTSSKKNYAKRLLIFGIISQIPYMWLNKDMNFNPFYFNVIILFLYSIGVLYLYDLIKINYKKYISEKNISFLLLSFLVFILMIGAIILPEFLEYKLNNFRFSYNYYGILMILIFYIFKERWFSIFTLYIVLTFASTYINGAFYYAKYSVDWFGVKYTFIESFKKFDIIWNNITTYKDGLNTLNGYFFQARSLMALPIIMIFEKFYINIKLNKYIAYYFYPLHIAILLLVRVIFY